MNSNDIMVKYLKNGDKVWNRGVLKTIRTTVVLTNTVNVTFTDGTSGFWNRGHIITLVP